ncbi:hypothetical protein ACHAXS_002665 [Conticribra weissflogii]
MHVVEVLHQAEANKLWMKGGLALTPSLDQLTPSSMTSSFFATQIVQQGIKRFAQILIINPVLRILLATQKNDSIQGQLLHTCSTNSSHSLTNTTKDVRIFYVWSSVG